MTNKIKLTVTAIEALSAGEKDRIFWDTEIQGFGLKVTPKGRKSYLLYHRTLDGKERKPSLGLYPVIRPDAARQLARQMLGQVASGLDPAQARKIVRRSETVSDLLDRYLSDHAERHKKASSLAEDRRQIEKIIKPAIGKLKIVSIARADIIKFQTSIPGRVAANRALALLSKAFNLAETWDLRPASSNPVHGVPKHKERSRERYLSQEEIHRLFEVLAEHERLKATSGSAIAAIRLLLLTGRRLSEVLTLEWSWIDLDADVLTLPDSKTGRLTLPLAKSAIGLLVDQRKHCGAQARYVLPGAKEGQRLVNLQKPWRRIRAEANLPDVRIHDLRHTYASVAAADGMSLVEIGRLLGHSQASTTQRYAHLSLEHLRNSADRVDQRMSESRQRIAVSP